MIVRNTTLMTDDANPPRGGLTLKKFSEKVRELGIDTATMLRMVSLKTILKHNERLLERLAGAAARRREKRATGNAPQNSNNLRPGR